MCPERKPASPSVYRGLPSDRCFHASKNIKAREGIFRDTGAPPTIVFDAGNKRESRRFSFLSAQMCVRPLVSSWVITRFALRLVWLLCRGLVFSSPIPHRLYHPNFSSTDSDPRKHRQVVYLEISTPPVAPRAFLMSPERELVPGQLILSSRESERISYRRWRIDRRSGYRP